MEYETSTRREVFGTCRAPHPRYRDLLCVLHPDHQDAGSDHVGAVAVEDGVVRVTAAWPSSAPPTRERRFAESIRDWQPQIGPEQVSIERI